MGLMGKVVVRRRVAIEERPGRLAGYLYRCGKADSSVAPPGLGFGCGWLPWARFASPRALFFRPLRGLRVKPELAEALS